MNKQEAIEKVKEHGEFYSNMFGGTVKMVPVGPIIDIVYQIHELQKVVVPKFAAEWIEGCKRSGWHLQKVLSRLDDDEKVGDWAYDENDDLIPEKVDMIARAWLDGYDIEKERLYTVEIPNPVLTDNSDSVTALMKTDLGVVLTDVVNYIGRKQESVYQLTESEIKQDFEWAWDARFAKPVEEN
ncbi:DUF1642 domain-containing protein [Streptococcus suis]|uniref:DUF1642 domain-containing protein n=1 Tax=Streptococcus suis TaxID=1307 RepID=UPI0007A59327|nr:DUF1642 domain-containing protein [Streptococcus suis]MBO4126802.1 DUF1642 domain-containing protein [Streptococcus suis]MBO4127778.1 DUF1642 domain-containing protein [Streptococcus suis]